ncbi:tetratricopeptide repeat protein, partial [Bacteroidota bacterium]
ENILKKASDKEKPKILNQLANEMKYINPQEAINYTNQAIELGNSTKNLTEVARAHFLQGIGYAEMREFDNARERFKNSLIIARKEGEEKIVADALASLGSMEDDLGNREKAIEYLREAKDISEKINYRDGINKSLNNLGIVYFYLGQYSIASQYIKDQYEYAKENKDTSAIASSLNMLGVFYYYQGTYYRALEYYLEALKISEKLGDQERIARNTLNIANIYKELDSFKEALAYYTKALNIFETLENKPNIATCYSNIGLLYLELTVNKIDSVNKAEDELTKLLKVRTIDSLKSGFDTSLSFLYRALQIREELKDTANLGNIYNLIGQSLKYLGRHSASLPRFQKGLEFAEMINDQRLQAEINRQLADLHLELGNYDISLQYFNMAFSYAKELELRDIESEVYKGLSEIYAKRNLYNLAYENYKSFAELKDVILGEETQRIIRDMEAKHKVQEAENQLMIQEAENEKQEAVIKQQRTVNIAVGFGAIFLLAFLVFAFYQIRLIRKKNVLLSAQNIEIQQQKEEIETQRDEIQAQRDLVMKQKEEITDSIHYALRIQRAVLPSAEYSEKVMPENFILFKPRDIVSGDYYWITYKNDKLITVAADCTGHGVPGAFMSMLGVSFLNEIVNRLENPESHIILNQLRNTVKTTLDQRGKEGEAKDGMDIALTILDIKNMKGEYSGAYNPMYIYRKGEEEVIEFKADKMPIGIYHKEKESFTKNEFNLKPGDTIYTFSDGYVDQFGGEHGRKFMSKPFKRLLAE